MADFTSSFWNWYIIIPTVGGIIACFLLIRWLSTGIKAEDQAKTMGHVWDEDLEELNNPLPRWWLGMFYITLVFGAVYLVLYPGLGAFPGLLKWSSTGPGSQYQREMDLADARFGPLFEKYQAMDVVAVADDPDARRMGERLFVNYCATCHGSDARGARGFPDLRDNDWLYGGSPEAIEQSILNGRNGVMPAWEAALGGADGVADMTEYVFSLSGRKVDAAAAARGEEKYQTLCVACHGADGTGNQALGAPNLTDNIFMYGRTATQVQETIARGRSGKMPPHRDFLGEAKVHLLAAYVYSLSTGQEGLEE